MGSGCSPDVRVVRSTWMAPNASSDVVSRAKSMRLGPERTSRRCPSTVLLPQITTVRSAPG